MRQMNELIPSIDCILYINTNISLKTSVVDTKIQLVVFDRPCRCSSGRCCAKAHADHAPHHRGRCGHTARALSPPAWARCERAARDLERAAMWSRAGRATVSPSLSLVSNLLHTVEVFVPPPSPCTADSEVAIAKASLKRRKKASS